MSVWTAKLIADHAAKILQAKVGSQYELKQVFPLLNRAYEYAWDYTDWNSLIVADSVTLAASQSEFVLPKQYKKLIYTFASGTGATAAKAALLKMGRTRWQPDIEQLLAVTSLGDRAVAVQPSAADAPKVVSSHASDTGVSVHIEGMLDGEFVSTTVTTNGTTPVESSIQFDRIDSIGASIAQDTPRNGVISVKSNDLATTYATISEWELAPHYAAYQLDATTSAEQTVAFIAKKRFRPFRDYLSVPFMDGLAPALIDGTVFLASTELGDMGNASAFSQMMDSRLRDLANHEMEPVEQYDGRY